MKKALVFAVAFVLAVVVGIFADELSGSWSTDICLLGPTPEPVLFESSLAVSYEVCGWTFGGDLEFNIYRGWESVAFDVYGALGAFAIDSDIEFDPSAASFTSWVSQVDLTISGVDLVFEFDLYDDYLWWTFTAEGAVGLCNAAVVAQFGTYSGYCFCFDQIGFIVDCPFLCDTYVYVSAGFSTYGFDGIVLYVTGVHFVEFPWLTFDFSFGFLSDDWDGYGKIWVFSPMISLTDACEEDAGHISLFVELDSTNATFDGINVYGIDIYKAWNGVWFQNLTSLQIEKDEVITGYSEYWEAIGVGTVGDSCCGGLFSFEIWSYFSRESTWLFDWRRTIVGIGIGIGSNFHTSFSCDIYGEVSDVVVEFCSGFAVTW